MTSPEDRERYQTVFARARGSIAAPTAGLHFTPQILDALDAAGVERVAITLHVGYGTFKPVRTEDVESHVVDPETYEIGDRAARTYQQCHRRGPAHHCGRNHDDASTGGLGVARWGSRRCRTR